ncbi:hypothetical protein NDU88_004390 [Pleurodeles waltl]|uniref:Uncharacterized protein n=1 Tax=Pleurodeles waltl TaxID=8319 RepID=A0AAV7MBK4_PLEWA|nr:hypothetical protein NDU88_004390 [Pleurodeles waltl]
MMSPHALALRPEPWALAALCLSRGTVQRGCTCPVSSRAHPPGANCTADQGPPRLRATQGPSTGDPEADRRHLTAAPTSHQGPSTGFRHQNGRPSLWRPNSPGTSRDTGPRPKALPPSIPPPDPHSVPPLAPPAHPLRCRTPGRTTRPSPLRSGPANSERRPEGPMPRAPCACGRSPDPSSGRP